MKKWLASEWFAIILILFGIGVFAFTIVAYFLAGFVFNYEQISPLISGQFGDLIGGVVGAMWALAGVILFYRALVKEKETTSNNRFNDTFFHLFNLYSSLISNMRIEVSDGKGHKVPKIGIDCFEYFHDKLRSSWEREIKNETIDFKQSIDNSVYNLLHHHKNNLIRYIGIIDSLLQYMDSHESDVQSVHLDLLRGSISSFERSFIFYYAMSKHCNRKLKKLIVDSGIVSDKTSFRLLKNEHYHLLFPGNG